MNFSNVEKRDILECYIKCNKNGQRAAERYFELYFNRRQPSMPTFKNIYDNLGRYGSFSKPKKTVENIDQETQINVLAATYRNPSTSTRELAVDCGTSQRTAVRILKKHKFHPYKLLIGQTLHVGDSEKRIRYCTWLLNMSQENQQFPLQVLWSDETRFTNCGLFNRHNEHMWMQANPHQVRQRRPQIKFGFNVWCGILGNQIIGPYIFNEPLNGERYLYFLQNNLEDYLDDIPLRDRAALQYFQHDGAPPHYSAQVTNYLNQRYPNKWIGRNGPIPWPPRSPDLAILDFFLWGTLKNQVYIREYDTVEQLREAVEDAISRLDRRKIKKAVNSIVKRCTLCINQNGNLFEYL